MTGDPVTPFMVDLWRFGALKGRESQAWDALRRNAFGTAANSRMAGRSGNPTYLDKGYVAYDRAFPSKGMDVDPHHGGSATLEYALADCARSRRWPMAWAMRRMRRRCVSVAATGGCRVRDAETGFTGFPRPRTEDGQWYAGRWPLQPAFAPRFP